MQITVSPDGGGGASRGRAARGARRAAPVRGRRRRGRGGRRRPRWRSYGAARTAQGCRYRGRSRPRTPGRRCAGGDCSAARIEIFNPRWFCSKDNHEDNRVVSISIAAVSSTLRRHGRMAPPRLFWNSPERAGRALRAVRGDIGRAHGRERAKHR